MKEVTDLMLKLFLIPNSGCQVLKRDGIIGIFCISQGPGQ